MNDCVLFSILIPAYKSQFFSAAIESILMQTYKDWELVIVDDHSPEDLKNIVDSFADNRIRYYRNEKNYGAIDVVDNWNKCLSYAKGDYVICMGDDDILTEYALEEYVNLIKRYPDKKIYHGRTEIIDENNCGIEILEPRGEVESPLEFIYYRWQGRKQYIGDFCYEKTTLISLGGYYKLPMAWASDDISAVRQAKEGEGIVNSNRILFKYRINTLSITGSGNSGIKMSALTLEQRWYEEFLKDYNRDLCTSEVPFYNYIAGLFEKFYIKKRIALISSDICANMWSIFVWLRKSHMYGISITHVAYAFVIGVIDRIKKHHHK